jgi:hypothetical protein
MESTSCGSGRARDDYFLTRSEFSISTWATAQTSNINLRGLRMPAMRQACWP